MAHPKEIASLELLKLIQSAPLPCFLLPQVVKFIREKGAEWGKSWTFQEFEFWLNHFSGLEYEEERLVRGKIAGKYIPRENYQVFFPVGMGKVYSGSHFVAAHLSPDIDTTVASFIVWLEAFACKVGKKQHLWNLPGGAPDKPALFLFTGLFGEGIFDILARKESRLFCVSRDLLTRSGFITSEGEDSILSLQHGYNQTAIVLVDDKGQFLGDWRTHDVERVSQITLLFKTALRAFETDFLISHLKILAKEKVNEKVWDRPLSQSDFSDEQNENLGDFLKAALHLPKGEKSTFGELFEKLKLVKPTLELGENPFRQLEDLVLVLAAELKKVRDWSDSLTTALLIKEKVLGHPPHVIKLNTDLDEIQLQMKDYETLTVVTGENIPIGIVRAKDIRESPLATVTFCDFCNYDEIRLPPYITAISVIDHHKTELSTNTPPVVSIGDAQSCNILVAELLFKLYDPYSYRGKKSSSIKKEIQEHSTSEIKSDKEGLRSLLLQEMAATKETPYFVHPEREKIDYLLCLNAILDDTDLLTKVSQRDVECVSTLLQRIETLESQKEAPRHNFYHLVPGISFAKKGAEELLELPLMKKIWESVLGLKRRDLKENLAHFLKKEPHTLFADTKIQNGSNLISQIKLFKGVEVPFLAIEKGWLAFTLNHHDKNTDIDLAILMLSSVTAEEGAQDEIVIWASLKEKGPSHLSTFLHYFLPSLANLEHKIQIVNDQENIFEESFKKQEGKEVELVKDELDLTWARIIYPAGKLNSRKSMISPYLPKLN